MPVRIPERRIREWLDVLDSLVEYARLVESKIGPATLILYGSFARGDFNLWSDVDVIVVSDAFEGVRPLDRYDLLPAVERVEPVPVTLQEFRKMLSKPSWRYALRDAVIIVDPLGVERLLYEAGINPRRLEELRARVAGLLRRREHA